MLKKSKNKSSLHLFEALVTELSQNSPDKKMVSASCEALGLPKNLDLTDLMQLLLEKYPDLLSQSNSLQRPLREKSLN